MDELSDKEIFDRLQRETAEPPGRGELTRILANIEDPANDEASKDRYVALVAGSLVDEGLRVAIFNRLRDAGSSEDVPGRFARRIEKARALGIVSAEQETEIHRIRNIRNAFAHAATPVGFASPDIETLTRRIFDYPVSNWAGYLKPVFSPRRQFAIVCGEFYSYLTRAPQDFNVNEKQER